MKGLVFFLDFDIKGVGFDRKIQKARRNKNQGRRNRKSDPDPFKGCTKSIEKK